jgi:multiple sugar transport system substrate-binding protein
MGNNSRMKGIFMRRKKFSMMYAALVIIMLLLSACGSSGGTSSSTSSSATGPLDAKKHYTVNFWEAFSTGANKTALTALTNQYMQQHPNVKVNLQAFDSYNTLETKINAAIAAKNPPTIAQVYETWASQYQQNGNIVSLQPYITGKNGISDLSDFYPALLKDGQINGTQYMLPFNKSDEVMYYNADLLKKLNITPPTSLTDFVLDLAKTTKSDNSQWGLSLTPSSDEWSIFYKDLGGKDFVSSNGQSVTFDQGANQQYALNALAFLAPLVKAKAVHVTTGYSWQNDFASQKSAFAISTIASYPFLGQAINGAFHFDEAPIPGGPGGQNTVLYGTNLALFKNVSDDNRAAAWDYMKFLTSAQADETFVQQTGYMPIRQSAFNSSTLQSYYTKFPARKVGPQQINSAFVASIQPGWEQSISDITNGYISVLKGQATAQTALSKMAKECNSDLSQ